MRERARPHVGRRLLQPALLAATLLAAACDSPTIPGGRDEAYYFKTIPRSAGERPMVVRWPNGSTIRVFLVAGSSERNDARLADAFAHGAAVWNDVAIFGEYRLTRAARIEDADVLLMWSDVPIPVDTTGHGPNLSIGRAVTTFGPSDADPRRLHRYPLLPPHTAGAGNIRMLAIVRSSEAGDAERVRRLVAHELGHVLGIANHSPRSEHLMTTGVIPTAEPTPADRETVQLLYRTVPDLLP